MASGSEMIHVSQTFISHPAPISHVGSTEEGDNTKSPIETRSAEDAAPELAKIEGVFLRALDKSSVPVCSAGDLYLGRESVFFTDGSSWYRIKFGDIEEINISERAKKIFFRLSNGFIGFSGRDEYRLSGLVHLLKPLAGGGA